MKSRPTMTSRAKEYLAYRRRLGFQLKTAGQLLLQFARYADQRNRRGPLIAELAVRWAGLPRHASRSYRACRLHIVRNFAKYLAISDPDTQIPPDKVFGSGYVRAIPHIYTPVEISALLAAARTLPPCNELTPHTYATLFGLVACTGLRLSEAVKLDRADIDWERGLLTIRVSKFRKSRLVPLHASALQALQTYAQLRDRIHPIPRTEAFFVSRRRTRLCHGTARSTFGKLRRQLGWSSRSGSRAPRIHDLRHTFACRRLIQWFEQGVAIDQVIAALATYLGHTSPRDTYWYLTGVPELLQLATDKFEHFATGD